MKGGGNVKQTPIREARLSDAARIKFGTATVVTRQGSVALMTTATVPIKPATARLKVVAA